MLTDFQAQNLTVMLSIPNITGTIPRMSVNNWIIVHQRLSTDNSIFKETFANYANGFGAINGSFWMGNEKVHLLTQTTSRPYMLRFEMLSTGHVWRSAEYTSFSLDDSSNFYTLHVSGYTGDSGDGLLYTGENMACYLNGMKFSTYDQDNDKFVRGSSSQISGNGGWWFNNCRFCCLTCDVKSYLWMTNPPNVGALQASRMMIKSLG